MSEIEDQLGAILGNPKMMADIMALAQSMGQEESPQAPEKPSVSPPLPSSLGDGGMDMAMVKALTSFTRSTRIEKEQQALLNALCPFISREKIQKLEKAMRAAKIAQQASGLLESGALKLP